MIHVGVAGWDYPDWEGVVYPAPHPHGFDRLAYLASFFDVIEINATFYRQPDAAAARSWVERVSGNPAFRFTAKLFRALTHSRWAQGRGERAAETDLPEEAERYRAGIAPLLSSGRLAAVLAQFPQGFHDREENRKHLGILRDLLAGLPLVVEFRHRSWDHADALRFLSDLGLGFCNIDQPSIGATLRPTGHVTSRIAYIRLHGRNTQNWFRQGVPVAARYDYLYSPLELRPWVERAERLDERAEEVHIIANNHYRGKGPANALMVKSAVARRRVEAPAELMAVYKDLKDVATPRPAARPAQRRLFD